MVSSYAAEDNGQAANGKEGWDYFDDETYAMQEPIGSDPESDSDFEYEGGRSKKGKGKKSSARKVGTSTLQFCFYINCRHSAMDYIKHKIKSYSIEYQR